MTSPRKPKSAMRRGEIIGERVDRKPATEAEHFIRCATCGGYFDMRDLAQALEHEGTAATPGAGQGAVGD